jgi:hypothetical protein
MSMVKGSLACLGVECRHIVEALHRHDQLVPQQHLIEAVAGGPVIALPSVLGSDLNRFLGVGRRKVSIAETNQPFNTRFLRKSELRSMAHWPLLRALKSGFLLPGRTVRIRLLPQKAGEKLPAKPSFFELSNKCLFLLNLQNSQAGAR